METPVVGGEAIAATSATATSATATERGEGLRAQVDPFLLEALENPRHRLTVLRMEIDIQKFMQNPQQYQFEFQYLPTSYLRCAAHRVAQHYGLLSMALDNSVGGFGTKVIARKTSDSKFPAVFLSAVPIKQVEQEKSERFKIVIRQRSAKASSSNDAHLGVGKDSVRSVEERMEDYDRARARIFRGPATSEVDESISTDSDRRSMSSSQDEDEYSLEDLEKTLLSKDNASRVAIFRDRVKDLTDPDYDRSYQKYARGPTPCQNFGMQAGIVPQPPFLQHEASSFNYLRRNQIPLGYNLSNPAANPYYPYGYNQNIRNDFCMQWPNPAMTYSYSYDHFRQAQFQAPLYQQPLSVDHLRDR